MGLPGIRGAPPGVARHVDTDATRPRHRKGMLEVVANLQGAAGRRIAPNRELDD